MWDGKCFELWFRTLWLAVYSRDKNQVEKDSVSLETITEVFDVQYNVEEKIAGRNLEGTLHIDFEDAYDVIPLNKETFVFDYFSLHKQYYRISN